MKALPVSISPINFNTKATGERNAGNPHVAFEVAGAGNGAKKATAPVLDPTGPNFWDTNNIQAKRRRSKRLIVI